MSRSCEAAGRSSNQDPSQLNPELASRAGSAGFPYLWASQCVGRFPASACRVAATEHIPIADKASRDLQTSHYGNGTFTAITTA
jgi:hypothetical protein